MPVLPKEEETGRTLQDQIAKESSDSQQKDQPSSSSSDPKKATIQDHQANLGPVISQNIGQPTSKEELKKRAEQLNK